MERMDRSWRGWIELGEAGDGKTPAWGLSGGSGPRAAEQAASPGPGGTPRVFNERENAIFTSSSSRGLGVETRSAPPRRRVMSIAKRVTTSIEAFKRSSNTPRTATADSSNELTAFAKKRVRVQNALRKFLNISKFRFRSVSKKKKNETKRNGTFGLD